MTVICRSIFSFIRANNLKILFCESAMAVFRKYYLKEVASDFNLEPKCICDILESIDVHPSNYLQVLTQEQLNYIFGYIIQNQELLCKGWFQPPNTYDCGSFVVN